MSTPAVTRETPAVSEREPSSHFLPTDKNYRLTGELPEQLEVAGTQIDKDEHIPAGLREEREREKEPQEKEPADTRDASAASTADTAAASAAADAQEKKGKTAQTSESRWAKLSRENRETRDENARLKAQLEERTVAASSRDTKPEPQPAAEANANARPNPDAIDPKTGQRVHKDWKAYEDALYDWIKKDAIREFQETSAKSAQEREAKQAQEAIGKSLAKKFEPVRSKYEDFDAVALNPDLVMPFGSVADLFIQDSEHAGEVAYHLGQHPEILEGFYGDFDPKTGKYSNLISPQQQFRKLMEIESGFSGAAKSIPPAKPVTAAPRPPNQVSSKGTVAKDAVEQAVEENDTETYMREQNARALARLKKGQ